MFTTPFSLIRASYIGGASNIVLAGNGPNAKVQLQEIRKDDDGRTVQVVPIEQITLAGKVTDMEICGVSSTNSTLLAVSTSSSRGSSVSVINLSHPESLRDVACVLQPSSGSAFTSLSYNADLEQLAAANDDGDVILWDMSNAKEIGRFKADAAGVRKVLFTRGGQILTSGLSPATPLLQWDARMPHWTESLPLSRPPIFEQVGAPEQYQLSQFPSHANSYYSSLSHYQTRIICGTSSGGILLWDTRTSGLLSSHQPHQKEVVAVQPHPSRLGVISASADGTVAITNTTGTAHERLAVGESIPIVQEAAAFTSLDVEQDSRRLLAGSLIGGLWEASLDDFA